MSNAKIDKIKKVLGNKSMTSSQILEALQKKYSHAPTMHELTNFLKRKEFEKVGFVEVKYRGGSTSQVPKWRLKNEGKVGN